MDRDRPSSLSHSLLYRNGTPLTHNPPPPHHPTHTHELTSWREAGMRQCWVGWSGRGPAAVFCRCADSSANAHDNYDMYDKKLCICAASLRSPWMLLHNGRHKHLLASTVGHIRRFRFEYLSQLLATYQLLGGRFTYFSLYSVRLQQTAENELDKAQIMSDATRLARARTLNANCSL